MNLLKLIAPVRNLRFDRKRAVLFLVIFLSGCSGATVMPSMVLSTSTESPSPTYSPTHAATSTSIPIRPPYLTTRTEPGTLNPTNTKLFVPHGTPLPTTLPTPTRGLASTATISPKEVCPPPTNTKVNIQFADDISDYGPQILKYFTANGGRADLQNQLEKLGRYEDRIANQQTGEMQTVFVPDVALFTEADITGDQAKETLITLKQSSPGGAIDTMIFIVGCQKGQYALLNGGSNLFQPGAMPVEGFGIADILDLNADGILEIILIYQQDLGDAHGDLSYSYNILEWNGELLRSLFLQTDDAQPLVWIETLNMRLEIRDIDNNGTMELLFPTESLPSSGFGPTLFFSEEIYMWDGQYYQYMWSDPGSPYYRFQAAFDGDYFAEIGLYDKAARFYRRAIDDPSLKPCNWAIYLCSEQTPTAPNNPTVIIAYSHLRLMELFAFLGKKSESENELTRLISDFPEEAAGYPYASLANVFWKVYQPQQDIDGACAALRAEVEKRPNEIFAPLFFGWGYPGPTIESICPFKSLSST